MPSATLRNRFLNAVARFNAGNLTVPAFWEEVEALNRAGFHREIKKGAEEAAVRRLTWCLDLYDAALQPRPGLLGRVLDASGAIFRNEYRFSVDDVRAMAMAVERTMKQADD